MTAKIEKRLESGPQLFFNNLLEAQCDGKYVDAPTAPLATDLTAALVPDAVTTNDVFHEHNGGEITLESLHSRGCFFC